MTCPEVPHSEKGDTVMPLTLQVLPLFMDVIFSFQGEFRYKHVNIPFIALK